MVTIWERWWSFSFELRAFSGWNYNRWRQQTTNTYTQSEIRNQQQHSIRNQKWWKTGRPAGKCFSFCFCFNSVSCSVENFLPREVETQKRRLPSTADGFWLQFSRPRLSSAGMWLVCMRKIAGQPDSRPADRHTDGWIKRHLHLAVLHSLPLRPTIGLVSFWSSDGGGGGFSILCSLFSKLNFSFRGETSLFCTNGPTHTHNRNRRATPFQACFPVCRMCVCVCGPLLQPKRIGIHIRILLPSYRHSPLPFVVFSTAISVQTPARRLCQFSWRPADGPAKFAQPRRTLPGFGPAFI